MRKFILTGFASLLTVATLVSCGKSGDTTATITVLDAGGQPVPQATVEVIGYDSNGACDTDPCRIQKETQTDGNGKATFNFNDLYQRGAAGFAVLEITAVKGTMQGDGIIKVEEETNSEATVSIQ